MPHWYSSEQGKHFPGSERSGAGKKKNQQNVNKLIFSELQNLYSAGVLAFFSFGYHIKING